jgi:hypothetical protein
MSALTLDPVPVLENNLTEKIFDYRYTVKKCFLTTPLQ